MNTARILRVIAMVVALVTVASTAFAGGNPEAGGTGAGGSSSVGQDGREAGESNVDLEDAATAVFAGGCFWCMEEAYEKVPGVIDAVSGYAGGEEPNPEYYDVAGGRTGHTEVVRVYYDPEVVTYDELLYVFWRNVDLTDGLGQFCDRGLSYRPEIFYESDEQRDAALASRTELEESGRFSRAIAVAVSPLDIIPDDDNDGFWIAEDYHQGYYLTNSVRYTLYKEACGRVRRLVQLWGDEAGAPSFQKSEG
jgi:peptide methionine sulfoxide reductase msrA/msrB